MAINATAVWRIRTGGSSLNGAGYDSAISGAGTDYSQQDAAQLSVTDGATSGAGSTTLTSVTGGFTAAMIGNAVRIASGTNFTVGYYFITAHTDTNTVTLDRSPTPGGAGSGGNVKVGGAQRQPGDSLYNSVVAGNTVYLRASAGNASSYPTASLDYTISAFFTPTNGTAADGTVKWWGENGMPTIDSPGLGLYLGDYQHYKNLYLVASSNSNGTNGVIKLSTGSTAEGCVINMNNQTSLIGVVLESAESGIIGCEVYGGTTSPTTSSQCYGVKGNIYGVYILDCLIRYTRDSGINLSSGGGNIINNVVSRCAGDGILASSGTTTPTLVIGNTVDANQGHGINVLDTNGAIWAIVYNNQITNHTQSGKVGLRCFTADSNRRKRAWGYNNVYNNTTNYENVSAESTDLSADPQYTNAAGGNFTPGNASMLAGFPTVQAGPFGAATNEVWIGAVQKEEPTGGGGASIISIGGKR